VSDRDRRPSDLSSPKGGATCLRSPLGADNELTGAPVQCLPWCTDGAGHPSAEEPEEQHCHSRPRRIDLGPTLAQAGGLSPGGHLVVQLYRDVYRSDGSAQLNFEPPHIEVYASRTEELKLSVMEARALAAVLLELCDAAEA
jgi:hypothetical protein